jgi:hypothetical protein
VLVTVSCLLRWAVTHLIESSAAFEVQSTTEGLYPQITTLQRDAIAAPATGLTIFNTTAVCLQWYRGAANGGWYDPCRAGVPTITSTVTTRIWMDRNLGVDQGLDINTITSKQILDSTVVCTSGVVLVTVTRL